LAGEDKTCRPSSARFNGWLQGYETVANEVPCSDGKTVRNTSKQLFSAHRRGRFPEGNQRKPESEDRKPEREDKVDTVPAWAGEGGRLAKSNRNRDVPGQPIIRVHSCAFVDSSVARALGSRSRRRVFLPRFRKRSCRSALQIASGVMNAGRVFLLRIADCGLSAAQGLPV
jgi:hypothetical protein